MNKIHQFRRILYFPIKDLNCTRSLVNHLVTSPNDAVILPYIDHPGPLSSEILSKDFRSLTICEPHPDIREQFKVSLEQPQVMTMLQSSLSNRFVGCSLIWYL